MSFLRNTEEPNKDKMVNLPTLKLIKCHKTDLSVKKIDVTDKNMQLEHFAFEQQYRGLLSEYISHKSDVFRWKVFAQFEGTTLSPWGSSTATVHDSSGLPI